MNGAERRAARWYRLRGWRILGTNVWAAGNELAAWIEAECTRTGANPVAVPVERPVAAPLPVSHGPEFPGDASFVSLEELAVR